MHGLGIVLQDFNPAFLSDDFIQRKRPMDNITFFQDPVTMC
ncbi:MAG: hypothetical protein ACK4V2_07895 [Pseudomonadota bacterium]